MSGEEEVTFKDITKALEHLIKKVQKQDEEIKTLRKDVNDIVQNQVAQLTAENDSLKQRIAFMSSRMEDVEFGTHADSHLNVYMQDESVQDATEDPLTNKKIAEGFKKYAKAKFGGDQ